MTLTFKAEYVGGALRPLEPLHLEEGAVVSVSIEEDNRNKPQGHGVLQTARRISEAVPEDAWQSLPTDGARNVDHYLYGTPKEQQ